MQTRKIELSISGQDINFEPTIQAYNTLINEIKLDNKVAPQHNYLMRIVCTESKEALKQLLTLPGTAMKLTEFVNKIFEPDLEITIKN